MERRRPCLCGVATCTATLHTRVAQVRRGARVVEVERRFWRCSVCRDPLTGAPLELIDAALAAENEDLAWAEWRRRFGEDLPPVLPPGRRPGRKRERRVTVLLSDEELARLDELRGRRTRSDFLREAALPGGRKAG